MSGIVGVFHRDGYASDRESVQRLTRFLRYRGPNLTTCWTAGMAALGQTHSQVLRASDTQDEPRSLGRLHIVGNVRLDASGELRLKLADRGQRVASDSSHLDLVLLAYATWGNGCGEYLRGDFAFGIWDEEAATLFCARDQFGVKPLYFHVSQGLFLFSNTLSCLREHPAVGGELNDAAVGDFLLFGLNYNKNTTTFRDIQRLPPAHWLLVTKSDLRTQRYWELPTEDRVRYARSEEYTEHFSELLTCGVADRLPEGSSGILLSGGLDSGAVAATARAMRTENGAVPRSYTFGYGSEDEEREWARTTARFLGLSNTYISLDIGLLEDSADPSRRFPEPVEDPLAASLFRQFEAIGEDCRVALSGEGADNLMFFQMWPYLKELRRTGQWTRFVSEGTRFAAIRPVPWLGVRRRVASYFRRATGRADLPAWIEPGFARRAKLLDRYREFTQREVSSKRHLTKPAAYASMALPEWGRMFELNDPGITRSDVQVRYPFLDLRMVSYLLAIPPFPWCYRKSLIRKAMEKLLPPEILQRRKTPLQRDPVLARLDRDGIASVKRLPLGSRTWDFISREKVATFCDTMRVEDLRPYCLGAWLRGVGQG